MDNKDKEFIINTAKEILLADLEKGQGIDKTGDDFKSLVIKVRDAVNSLEKAKPLTGKGMVDLQASNRR